MPRPGPVVRRVQEIVKFSRLCQPGMALDHAAAPIIRARIVERAKHALQGIGCEGALRKLQPNRIESDSILTIKVASTIDKLPLGYASSRCRQLEAPGSHRLRLAR